MKKHVNFSFRSLPLKLSLALTLGLTAGLTLSCGNGAQQAPPNPVHLDGLYVHSFGDSNSTAVIFIHDSFGDASVPSANRNLGGPSLNSMYFEFGLGTTLGMAEQIAEKNFYVISYDLRGQGRSADARTPADYSYKQSAADINMLIASYGLSHPILIGHSHGGIIALKYDELFPNVSRKIILVDTPLDVFQAMNTISTNCQARYTKPDDASKVADIKDSLSTLSNTDTPHNDRAKNVKKLFEQAATCGGGAGLYTPKTPVLAAVNFYAMISELLIPISPDNQTKPVAAFLDNEDYIHVNEHANVTAHNVASTANKNYGLIQGIYGSEDGMFDSVSLALIKTSLGADTHPERMTMLPSASHNAFVDQSAAFLAAIVVMLNSN